MDLKSKIQVIGRVLLIFIFVFPFCIIKGQQTPASPISYWVFTPYIYNPAIIGSKDFLSIGLNAAFQGNSNNQIISGNTRFSKTKSGYFSSPDIVEFRNIGIGGSIFNDINGLSHNIGLSVSGSYQIPLNTRELSFLSFGASVKGVYNKLDPDSTGQGNPIKETYFPILDLGIYYYGTNFFTGISTTNIFGNPGKSDSLVVFEIPVSRQYFFSAGYKILLSKYLNIVLEPSVLISANDSTIRKISNDFNYILKLFIDNFCFGTSFQSDGKISFFSQYRYPRFYVGAFFGLPKNLPYFKRKPLVEFTMGINIPSDKSRLSNHSHW